jgi:hypothetical protein
MNEVRLSPLGRPVTRAEAAAAAKVLVVLDKTRGRETEQWIRDLAAEGEACGWI